MSIKDSGYPFEASGICLTPAIREGHHLVLSFQLPPLLAQYGAKADEYVSHLVGHEGPGSLLSELKARNWATGLSAGAFRETLRQLRSDCTHCRWARRVRIESLAAHELYRTCTGHKC